MESSLNSILMARFHQGRSQAALLADRPILRTAAIRAIQMLISLPIYDLFNLLMTNIRELVTYYHRGSVSYAKEASTALPSQRNSHLFPRIEAVLQRYRNT